MPRTRFDELVHLAEEHDGVFTSREARNAGFADSVIARLAKRARLQRVARGVYRIPYVAPTRFSQYQEAVLWARAHRTLETIALSHETALAVFGISDANPAVIHLTIPKAIRMRKPKRKGVAVHRSQLGSRDITTFEGLPVTTVARTILDLSESGGRMDIMKQAISGARREGLIDGAEARRLRYRLEKKHTVS